MIADRCLSSLFVALAFVTGVAHAEEPASISPRWSATLYVGQFYHDHLQDIVLTDALFTESNFYDSRVVTLSLGRELARSGSWVAWEAEAMVGKHFGLQDHLEVNAFFAARWLRFPWDRLLDTSFAVGEGISWAAKRPFTEGEFRQRRARHILNYFVVEAAFSLPRAPRWSLVSRVHHRSGVFGLFGTREGSNFVGFGLRRHF